MHRHEKRQRKRLKNPQHEARKEAARRKAAAQYRDGRGWERVLASRAKAAVKAAVKAGSYDLAA